MMALVELVLGMLLGIACRELWARRDKLKGIARTLLMSLVLIVVWAPLLWLIVTIFLKRPPG